MSVKIVYECVMVDFVYFDDFVYFVELWLFWFVLSTIPLSI